MYTYTYVYALDKALLQVLYGVYSMKDWLMRGKVECYISTLDQSLSAVYSMSKGSALCGSYTEFKLQPVTKKLKTT